MDYQLGDSGLLGKFSAKNIFSLSQKGTPLLVIFAMVLSMATPFIVFPNFTQAAPPDGSTLLFSDTFDQDGSSMTNGWDEFDNSSDGNRDDVDTEGSGTSDDFTVGITLKGLLLEGSNGSDPDEGVERKIATQGYSSLYLEYSRAWKGGEGDDTFIASYSLDDGSFTELESQTLETTTAHTLVNFTIPNTNRNTKLILRLEVNGSDNNDNVGIDDVKIYGSNAPIFYDGFESGGFSTGEWVTTDGDDSAGTNLPSIEHDDGNDNRMWTDDNSTATGHSTGTDATNGHSAKIEGNPDANPDEVIEKSFNSTGYENIYIRYARRTNSLEPSDDDAFLFQYSTDAGDNWITMEDTNDDIDYGTVIWGPLSGANNNANLKFRFLVNGNNDNDDVYIDDMVIWGDELTTGSITITKTTVGGDGTFEFSGDAGTFSITTTGGTGTETIEGLEPGEYTISEDEQDGWDMTENTCQDIEVVAGETAECDITNKKWTIITGLKWEDLNGNGQKDDGEAGIENWEVELRRVTNPGQPVNNIPIDTELVQMSLTGSGGQFSLHTTTPGTYIVTENSQDGWQPMYPVDSFFDIFIDVNMEGQTINNGYEGQLGHPFNPLVPTSPLVPLEFGNFELITITIEKDVVAPDGETDVEDNHEFTTRIDTINGEETTEGDTLTFSEDSSRVYEDIGPGTYKVNEITGDPDFDLLRISAGGETVEGIPSIEFDSQSGHNITVTITNKQKEGTLTVKKVVTHPNGGTETANQFSFTVNDGETTPFTQNESDPLLGEKEVTVNPGTYTVTEDSTEGNYAISYNNCTSVVVPSNGSATCTIINSDIPEGQGSITIIKDLPNDNGGTFSESDFPLWVTSVPEEGEPEETEMTSGEFGFFEPGDYDISEENPNELEGFTTSISCTDGETTITDSDGDIILSLVEQQSWICTITNDDEPGQLIIVKETGNTAYNDTFNFTVSGTDLTPSIITTAGTGQTDPITLDKDSYNVVETIPTDWDFSNASCLYEGESAGSEIENGKNITLDSGDSVTCTFTNSRQTGSLTIIKVVETTDEEVTPEDFTIHVMQDATDVAGSPQAGSAEGAIYEGLPTGDYTISETGLDGYEASYSESCAEGTATVVNGETVTCTITNTKITDADGDGQSDEDETTCGSNPNDAESESLDTDSDNIPNCVDTDDDGDEVADTADNCPVDANTDQADTDEDGTGNVCDSTPEGTPATPVPAKLTVIKEVINNNGKTKTASQFSLFVGETAVTTGVENEFTPGTYNVHETADVNYTIWTLDGDCALNGDITLVAGDVKTCRIVNDDVAPESSGGGGGGPINTWTLGDINKDGKVDALDLAILFANWGANPANPDADVNKDGVVNIIDFSILMVNWTI